MSTFNLQLEDYVKSVADSILMVLTLSKDDSVRGTAWEITGVKNNFELSTRVQHELQHFFEYANKKKIERNLPIDSDSARIDAVCHKEDDCFSDTTSEEDMFSDSSCCFSSDECPSTTSPKYFSSDASVSLKEYDIFSSDESTELMVQAEGDVRDGLSSTLPIDDIDEINPFVNALKVSCSEEVGKKEEEEDDCWSQEDMPTNYEETSCFSSSSKEYMDL